MDLQPPPASRPVQHLLRAHRAHAEHHGQLEERQPPLLESAIVAVSKPAVEPAAAPKKRRARRST